VLVSLGNCKSFAVMYRDQKSEAIKQRACQVAALMNLEEPGGESQSTLIDDRQNERLMPGSTAHRNEVVDTAKACGRQGVVSSEGTKTALRYQQSYFSGSNCSLGGRLSTLGEDVRKDRGQFESLMAHETRDQRAWGEWVVCGEVAL
jgi:hypothetical protein